MCTSVKFRVQVVNTEKSTGKIDTVTLSQSHWDCHFSNWFEEDGLGRVHNTNVFANISEYMFTQHRLLINSWFSWVLKVSSSGFQVLSGFLFGFRALKKVRSRAGTKTFLYQYGHVFVQKRFCTSTWPYWYKNRTRNPKRNPERNPEDGTFSTIGCILTYLLGCLELSPVCVYW